jgi:pilus assembly protein CpaE
LGEDWRFGRVNIAIRGEDLDQAISHYERRKSPTLIIIQTDEIGEEFESKLGQLANLCSEDTAAIVIGPDNDVQLYRHLINIGVSDYLVAPLDYEGFIEAIAASLENIVGSVDSHLMTLIGAKGGVGTTCISAMIADILSKDFGAKTLIMDAAGAHSTLWNHFEFSPSGKLIEAARAAADKDKDALDRLIVKKSETLHILNTGAEHILENPVAAQAYEILLDHMLSIYPYIVLDTSGAPTPVKKMAVTRASNIAIVSGPRVPDLSQTKIMIKSLGEIPGAENRKVSLFINKMGAAKLSDIPADDIKQTLNIEDIVTLDWDPVLFAKSENAGEPIFEQSQYKKYSNIIKKYIADSTGLNLDKDDLKNQEKNGFMAKLSSVWSK